MIGVEVDDRGVGLALAAVRLGLDRLEPAWQAAGGRILEETSPFVPVLTGTLVDSLAVVITDDGVEVRPTGAGEDYAGVIDQGWPARNIAGAHFTEAGADASESAVVDELTTAIDSLIARVGLD